MHCIDEIFTESPFYGSRRIREALRRQGWTIGRERVQSLMRQMGLEAIYPKVKLSKKHPNHRIYPYLLSKKDINRPNEVWSADITYIRLRQGFVYLVAIMDWFSRYVLSWRLSNSLDVSFCIEALEEALGRGCPEIFNTDQGSQFTSDDFTGILLSRGIAISMDGRGRVFDNIFTERLWRSVKYEEVYIKGYQVYRDAQEGLGTYFPFYNNRRYHQSLAYRTPYEVYYGSNLKQLKTNWTLDLFLLGDSVPQAPWGLSLSRDKRNSLKKRAVHKARPYTSVHPPRRSGRSPALPYPPGGYNKIGTNKFIIQLKNASKKKGQIGLDKPVHLTCCHRRL
jgi:putative transposase